MAPDLPGLTECEIFLIVTNISVHSYLGMMRIPRDAVCDLDMFYRIELLKME